MKKLQIGNLIEKAREDRDWSRETLAEKLEVATTTVFRWETNKQGPSFEAVVILARVLGKPLEYFTGAEKIEHKPTKLSDLRNSLDSIPDDVFDMLPTIGSDHRVWEFVRGAYDAALKSKDKTKGKPA